MADTSKPATARQQQEEQEAEKAATQGARLDLSHGFVRHIKHMQHVRNRVEEEWKRDQQPDKVAERIRTRMPTAQELRKHRQRELARNGPSAKLASRAFGAVLGGGLQRQPHTSRAKRPAAATTATQPPSQRQKSKGAGTTSCANSTAQRALVDAAAARLAARQASRKAEEQATPASDSGTHGTKQVPGISLSNQQQEPHAAEHQDQKRVQAPQEPRQHAPPADEHKPPQQQLQEQQQQQSREGVGRPVFRLEVELDDSCTECLVVREGDEPAEVVLDFGLQHDLTDEQIEALTQHLVEEFERALA